jgi:hypothetical protein
MKKLIVIYCPIFLLVTMLGLHVQQSNASSDCVTNPPDFGMLSYQAADSAVYSEEDLIGRKVRKICPEYITNLINQLQYGQLRRDNKALAIDLLGALRPSDSNSIEYLIQNIDFERTNFDDPNRISTQLKYPCEGALMRIGQPVVVPILNHLSTETNELRRHLMCEILAFVNKPMNASISEGKKKAQQQISQKLAAEMDITKQANFKAALKDLEK